MECRRTDIGPPLAPPLLPLIRSGSRPARGGGGIEQCSISFFLGNDAEFGEGDVAEVVASGAGCKEVAQELGVVVEPGKVDVRAA